MFVLENTARLSTFVKMSRYHSVKNVYSAFECVFYKVCDLLNLER